jgi:hypothetical protein
LRGEKEACLTALEISKGKGSLPDPDDILNDPDLANVKNQDWFAAFMESLNQKPEIATVNVPVNAKAEALDKDETATIAESEAVIEPIAQIDKNVSVTAKSDAEACLAAEDFK